MSYSAVKYDWEARYQRAKTLMEERSLDALYLTAGPNQYYFSGFSGYDGGWPIWLTALIVPHEGDPEFVMTDMHADIFEYAHSPIGTEQVHLYSDGEDPSPILEEIFDRHDLTDGRIGVEQDQWFGDTELLRSVTTDAEIVNAQAVFDRLRMIKDDKEVENIRKATEIATQAFEAAVEETEVGKAEYEVAHEMSKAMLDAGAETMGQIGGMFRELRDREFEPGDILRVDNGPQYQKYSTDTGRNFFLEEVEPEHEEVYRVVADCFEVTFEAIEPGVTCHEVHMIAEEYLNERDYDLPWKIGHGVGLMGGHQAPLVQAGNDTELEPGMVFVIDPGTHVPWEGRDMPITIEDPILVTEDGAENLGTFTHDPIII